MKFNTFKFKISVLYTVILGIILIVYSGILYFSLQFTLYEELDRELLTKSNEMKNAMSSYLDVLGFSQQTLDFTVNRLLSQKGSYPGQEKLIDLENQWIQKVDKYDIREDYIILLNSNSELVAKSPNFPKELLPAFIKKSKKLAVIDPVFSDINFDHKSYRLLTLSFSYQKNQYIIQILTSLKPIIHLLKTRLFHIVVSIPLILLFSFFLGGVFVRRVLRPVYEITDTASKITHEDLKARVKIENYDEEMKYLANAFNQMICRLENSFKHIAEFSSQVSHELKTPLAIIKGESEYALKIKNNPREYRKALRINFLESNRMLKTIEDLLLLTRLNYRQENISFEKIDIKEFMQEIYEQSKILALKKKIVVKINLPKPSYFVEVDKLHLRRLFFNIVNNAIKFTPKKGEISIELIQEKKDLLISIADTGVGITEEDISRIFERFFHVNRTGQNIEPGNGLGLHIAKSIAVMHNGDIRVQSTFGKGAVFTVVLPLK